MSLDKNLTLFIPTKNRPSFIKRIVKYYTVSKFTGKILIGDSSDSIIYNQNKLVIDKTKNFIDINHYFMPNLSSGHTCAKLIEFIDTDYAAQINDDDILISGNIVKSIKIMNESESVSGINGKALLLGIKEDNAFGEVTWINHYTLGQLSQKNPYERVKDFLNNQKNLNLSIFRSKYYNEIYKKISKLSRINSYYDFEEIIHGIIMSSNGRIMQKEYLSNIRQGHKNQLYHSVDIYNWLTDSNWSEANLIIKDLVMNIFNKYSDKTEEENLKEFKNIFLKRYYKKLEYAYKINNQQKQNIYIYKKFINLLSKLKINSKNNINLKTIDNKFKDDLYFFIDVIREKNE